MTHVVTDACIDCRYTDCVEACPVDAFKSHQRMLVIDPTICIDCSMCIDECPVNAIVTENSDHPKLAEFITYAEEASKVWPTIRKMEPPLDSSNRNPDNAWDNRPHIEKRD